MSGGIVTYVAESVPFDNDTNGFVADNVQEAIEEIVNNPVGDDLGNHTATQALDMATFGIDSLGDIDFVINGAIPIHSEGRVFYDKDEHTLTLYNDQSGVSHQLGQEGLIRVYNNTGIAIANGKCLYITGEEEIENRPTVGLANAASASTAKVIGLSTQLIPIDSFGYVTKWGFLNDIDTTGLSEGAALYLSDTIPGDFSELLPSSTSVVQQVGYVVHAITGPTGRLLVDLRGIADPRSNRATIVLSFQSSSAPYISSTSTQYTTIASFEYSGSDTIFSPSQVVALAGRSSSGNTDLRVWDATNSLVIAEITGTPLVNTVVRVDMGAVANLPALPAVFEFQAARAGGGGSVWSAGLTLS
jgi:hypothetical protein